MAWTRSLSAILFIALVVVEAIISSAGTIDNIVQQHTFQAPFLFGRTTSVPFFEYGGSAVATESFVRLTPAIRGRGGHIWNTEPAQINNWQAQVEFKIHNTRSPGADGLAFWYTKEAQKSGSLFGNQEDFVGLGIIVDTYDNDGKRDAPKILAVVNKEGQQHSFKYDADHDGEANKLASCQMSVRNKPQNIKMQITYDRRTLRVTVDNENKGEFKECFAISDIDLPTGYFFGASAGTGGLSDYHDLYSFIVRNMDPVAPTSTPSATPDASTRTDRYSRMRNRYGRDTIKQQQQQAAEQAAAAANSAPPASQASSTESVVSRAASTAAAAEVVNNVAKLLHSETTETPQTNQQQPQQSQQPQQTHYQQQTPSPSAPATAASLGIDLSSITRVEEKLKALGAVLEVLAPSVANAASKRDIEQLQQISSAQSSSIETLRNDITRNFGATLANLRADTERIQNQVHSVSEQVRRLSETIEQLTQEHGNVRNSFSKSAEDLASTIRTSTSFGFWTWFLLFQVSLVAAFVGYQKYYKEKNKKLF